jgi:peptidoglycan/LPS O-acetylase OafA/YrhL
MKINYRPEIDTLRAISVIGVIIYHAKINIFGYWIFQGGYYGVDIFFVISGYLITSVIYRELKKTGKFSFTKFYIKRARRILPALLFVMFVCIPLAWKYLMPTSFIDFSKSILSSLSFISNYYFYITGLEYGAENGLLKPLLHTWSLSVEEQFYILFPILFVSGFIFFKKKLFQIILLIAILSFIFAEFLSFSNPILNFYILPSRIWELLIGSYLFYFEKKFKLKYSNQTSNLICFAGLTIILISFMFFYEVLANPNLKSLLPIIGTILIILFSKKDAFLTKFFTNKIFVGIGIISYSLYLWHYPIFAFLRNASIVNNYFLYFLISIFIFFISWFSYFFIEKPFRDKKKIADIDFIKILFSASIILIFTSLMVIKNKGFENRFPNETSFSVDNQRYNKEVLIKKYELGIPQFRNPDKKNVLIIGNSHGEDLFYALKMNEDLFPIYEFSILSIDFIKCLNNLNKSFKLCEKKLTNKNKNNFLNSEIIIISSTYNNDDILYLDGILLQLKAQNKNIIITSRMPLFYFKDKFSLIDKFYLKNKRLPNKDEKLSLEKEYFNSKNIGFIKSINNKLESISKKNNVKFLQKEALICQEIKKTCQFLTPDNHKIFRDGAHTTIEGASFIGKEISNLNWLAIDFKN